MSSLVYEQGTRVCEALCSSTGVGNRNNIKSLFTGVRRGVVGEFDIAVLKWDDLVRWINAISIMATLFCIDIKADHFWSFWETQMRSVILEEHPVKPITASAFFHKSAHCSQSILCFGYYIKPGLSLTGNLLHLFSLFFEASKTICDLQSFSPALPSTIKVVLSISFAFEISGWRCLITTAKFVNDLLLVPGEFDPSCLQRDLIWVAGMLNWQGDNCSSAA